MINRCVLQVCNLHPPTPDFHRITRVTVRVVADAYRNYKPDKAVPVLDPNVVCQCTKIKKFLDAQRGDKIGPDNIGCA
jgi:hypothetical protein